MKVLCVELINKYSHYYLTIGKWYDVDIEETFGHYTNRLSDDSVTKYFIKLTDSGSAWWLDKQQFITEQQHRDNKLKGILS